MTDHPITPPPELRQLWAQQAQRMDPHDPVAWMQHVSAKAARWGADQELEACCDWLDRRLFGRDEIRELRAARRPKPPSLKEQAIFAAAVLRSPDETCSIAEIEQHWHTIRRALEQLDG